MQVSTQIKNTCPHKIVSSSNIYKHRTPVYGSLEINVVVLLDKKSPIQLAY